MLMDKRVDLLMWKNSSEFRIGWLELLVVMIELSRVSLEIRLI